MKQEPNELVRNKIPAQLKEQGFKVKAKKIKDDKEFAKALKEKFSTISRDISRTSDEDLAEALADVFQVTEDLVKAVGLTMKDVKQAKIAKKSLMGGFSARKLLVSYQN